MYSRHLPSPSLIVISTPYVSKVGGCQCVSVGAPHSSSLTSLFARQQQQRIKLFIQPSSRDAGGLKNCCQHNNNNEKLRHDDDGWRAPLPCIVRPRVGSHQNKVGKYLEEAMRSSSGENFCPLCSLFYFVFVVVRLNRGEDMHPKCRYAKRTILLYSDWVSQIINLNGFVWGIIIILTERQWRPGNLC